MSFIEWNPSLDVPHEKINEQHHTLVEAVNRLHEAVTSGAPDKSLTDLLLFLTNYVGQHFADEEDLMKSVDYPHYEEHRDIHRKLFLQVQARTGALIRGEAVDGPELLEFLKTWLTDHILGTDAEMAKFVTDALGAR